MRHISLRLFLILFGSLPLVYLSYLLCIAPSPVMAQSPSLQKGIQALEKGRIDEALGLLRQAIQEDPQSAEAFLYLGRALHQTRQFKDAEQSYVKSLGLDPNNLETRLRLGVLYEDEGRLPEAQAAYQEVIKVAGSGKLGDAAQRRLTRIEVGLHFTRAMDLIREGKSQEAIAELEEVLHLDPKNAEAYFDIGEIYRRLKQWDQALQAYHKAVELNPGYSTAHLRLGRYYDSQKEWENARESYERVLTLRQKGPEVQEAAEHLGEVKRQIRIQELIKEVYERIDKHEKEEALKGVDALLEIDPENAMAYYFRGYVADAQKRDQDAIRDLTRAMELAPGYLPAAFKLGTVYQRTGETEKAISLYQDVIARGRPEDDVVKRAKEWLASAETSRATEATLEEARASLKQGDVEATQESIEEAVRLRPKDVQSTLLLSMLYAKNGQRDKALAVLRRGVENNPDSPKSHLNLGLFLEQMGQLEEAGSELRKVISLGGKTAEVRSAEEHLLSVEAKQHFQEARGHMNNRDYEAALPEIQKVIAILPDDASAYLSQGIIYDRLNKTEDAIGSLRKAIELNPKYVDAHLQIAIVLEGKGGFEEARSEYETALSLNPDEKTTSLIRSRLEGLEKTSKLYEHTRIIRDLFDAKKFQEALAETETLIALNPSNYMGYFYRGMAHVELKQPLDAIEAFRKALELQPKALYARLQLGRVYMDEGRYEEAREQFEQVVREGEGRREGDFAAMGLKRLRTLSYSVSYGLTLNSNITQRATPITGESSSLSAGLHYILARQKQWRILASGSASQSINFNSQLTGNGFSGSFSGQYQIGDQWGLSGGLSLNYGFFEGEKTSLSRSLSMGVSVRGKGIPTGMNFSYSFSEARSFRSAASNTDNHTVSVSGSQQLTAKDQVNMTYSFASSINLDSIGSNFAYRSNAISMGYNRGFIKDMSGNIGLNLTSYNYSNPDSTTLFQRFRETHQYGLSMGFSALLSEQVSLNLNYSYTNSATNIKVSALELQTLADILASPIPIVGGDFEGYTLSISTSVAF